MSRRVVFLDRLPEGDRRGQWRAVVMLPEFMSKASGVSGGATKDGPFVEGFGWDGEAALSDAMGRIGRAVLRMTECPPIVAGPEPSEAAS